jgi:hypothetical protein
MHKKTFFIIFFIISIFSLVAKYYNHPNSNVLVSKLKSNVFRDCFYFGNKIYWSVNTPYHVLDDLKNKNFDNFGIFDLKNKRESNLKLNNISESRFFFTYKDEVYLLSSLDCYLYKINTNGKYIKIVDFKMSGWIYNAVENSGNLYFTIAGGMNGGNSILYKLNLSNYQYEKIDLKNTRSIGIYQKVINFDHYGNLWIYSYDYNSFFLFRIKEKIIYELKTSNNNKIVTLGVDGNIVIKDSINNLRTIKKYELNYKVTKNLVLRLDEITDLVNLEFLNRSLKNIYFLSSKNQIVFDKKYKFSLSDIMKIYPKYNIDISNKQDREIEWVDSLRLNYRIIGFDGKNLIINKVGYLDFYYINITTFEITHDSINSPNLINAPISSLSVSNKSLWYSSYITHGEIYDNNNNVVNHYFSTEGQIDFLFSQNCIKNAVKLIAFTYPGAVLFEFCNKHNFQSSKTVIPGNFQRFVKVKMSENSNGKCINNIIAGVVESDYENLKRSAVFIKTSENVSVFTSSKFQGKLLEDIFIDRKNIYAISKSYDNVSFVYLKHDNKFKLRFKFKNIKIIEIKNNHILYLEKNRIIDFDIIKAKSVILYTNSILSYLKPSFVKCSNQKLFFFYSEFFIYINLVSKKIYFSLNKIRYLREGSINIEKNTLYLSQADKIISYKLN